MSREHRIRITWSPEQRRIGLPTTEHGIDPVLREAAVPERDEAWSLAYRFDRSPQAQGSPSEGYARLVLDDAPDGWLVRGAVLQLFERATGRYARVDVLD